MNALVVIGNLHKFSNALNSFVTKNTFRQVILLSFFWLLSSIGFYLPFLGEFDVIYRYWDGPNYVWVAKTLYNSPVNHPFVPYGTTPAYFVVHLPLYPLAIRALSFIGYFPAMIVTALLSAWAAVIAFFFFLKETKLVASPLWTAALLLFLPGRYLIYSHVGASEPLFVLLLIVSLYAFHCERFWLAFALAALASITRITGILLGPVFLILLIYRQNWRQIPKLAIIGVPLFLTFCYYQWQLGDFWAYFSWNHGMMQAIPAGIMRAYAYSGSSHSAELVLLLYTIYGAGALMMRNIDTNLFVFGCVFFGFSVFIFHEDNSRYLIPLAPFTFLISFDPIFKTREFKWAYVCMIVPMTYVYSFGLVPQNLVVDWVFKDLLTALGG